MKYSSKNRNDDSTGQPLGDSDDESNNFNQLLKNLQDAFNTPAEGDASGTSNLPDILQSLESDELSQLLSELNDDATSYSIDNTAEDTNDMTSQEK